MPESRACWPSRECDVAKCTMWKQESLTEYELIKSIHYQPKRDSVLERCYSTYTESERTKLKYSQA